jgi:phytoene synthase
MADAFEHCERLVREHDKDRFLSSLFASAERRPLLHAIYAFDIEIAGIALRVSEPLAGEVRLQWWRDIISGERAEEAAASPVATALRGAMTAVSIDSTLLDTALDAASRDAAREPIRTMEEFARQALDTRGSILRIAAAILGAQEGRSLDILVSHASFAMAALDAVRRFALRASRGQLQIPTELLNREDEADWSSGRATPALMAALLQFRTEARRQANDAMAEFARAVPQPAWPAFLHIGLVPLYLDRMESRSYDPFRTPLDVPQWQRQWRLWRLSRVPAAR